MTDNEARAKGCAEIVRFLEDHGHEHVFGLPGSQMVSLLHEISRAKIRYVPTIHESVTIAAADGYARLRGSGVALVYMLPGTANGLANIYNAWRDETPLIVLASQQESTMRSREGTTCEGDTVALVRPFTRIAHELTRDTPVRPWLERARRAASGPPSGPAYLSIDEDVFVREAPVVDDRLSVRPTGGTPDVSAVATALARAERPLIVVGGQARRFDASDIIEEISDRFEIPVAYEFGFQDRLGVGPGRRRTVGSVLSKAGGLERDADVALVIGARLVLEGHPRSEPFFGAARFVAHVNADAAKLEETRTADWSAACDPAAFAKALLDALSKDPPSADLLAARADRIARAQEPRRPAADSSERLAPLAQSLANYQRGTAYLHDALDHGWLVDESVMGAPMMVEALTSTDGRRYIGCSGASLGWATGAAAGVALASGEPVTCVLGDGSLRFGALGLWTISALKLPVTIVVLDNGGYGSTRFFEREYIAHLGPQASARAPGYLNMDMRSLGPGITSLIQGFGVRCRSVAEGDDVRAALEEAWAGRTDGPNAVVVPLGFEG